MKPILNETHNAAMLSWVSSANTGSTDFPIQNLPFGVFRLAGSKEQFRIGVAIGDQILDLSKAHALGLFAHLHNTEFDQTILSDSLNGLMNLGPKVWSDMRLVLSRALRQGAAHQDMLHNCLLAQNSAEYSLPAKIGDYTDFYTSIHHATAVGKLFRPDNPLLPNYKWVPIGYHGRSSSIGVSGQEFHRPVGQTMPPAATEPVPNK